jgi:RNA polymerase sigma factor (sigma-70 family)
MPMDSMARLLPHLRRVALARDAVSSDGQLLGEFIASHDEAAFAGLVRRHGPMVLGVCRRVVGDSHLAEDAFQATFLVLARRAATVRPRHLVGHWLYGVANRTAMKARGNAARRKSREKQVDAMPQPAVSPEEVWADLQPVLDAELNRLPDKYRVPVVLCDLGGRPQREVARELKLPAATLANRLAAARRLLAKRLSDRGIVLSASAITAALTWHAATSAVSPGLACSTAKAACAIAAGGVPGLPAPIVELSDGVMRMFVLKKLKAIAGACVVLLAGLGLVADSTLRAGPAENPAIPPRPVPVKSADPKPAPEPEDAVFLRRTSLDLRGTMPSLIEMTYFLADTDSKKRKKIVEWMLPEHGKQKASMACKSCHSGVAFADFDHDGFLDILITNRIGRENIDVGLPEKFNINHYFEVDRDGFPDIVVGSDNAEVKTARAALAAANASLAQWLAHAKLVAGNDAEAEKAAKAQVTQAEANLKAAETRLKHFQELMQAKPVEIRNGKTAEDVAKQLDQTIANYYRARVRSEPSDVEFLRRASLDVRGVPPSKVEENYFVADKDPKKREKLLQMLLRSSKAGTPREKFVEDLLADPQVQSRWAELWKERIAYERQMEQAKAAAMAWLNDTGDRLSNLLNQLLESKRNNEQILEALCLATMARFPTDIERKLVLDVVKTQPDRRAAWGGVLQALAASDEAKSHAEAMAKRTAK